MATAHYPTDSDGKLSKLYDRIEAVEYENGTLEVDVDKIRQRATHKRKNAALVVLVASLFGYQLGGVAFLVTYVYLIYT